MEASERAEIAAAKNAGVVQPVRRFTSRPGSLDRMAHSHSHGGHCSHDHGAPPPAAALAAPERPPRDMDAVLHPNDPLLSGGIAAGEGSSGAPGLADGSFKTSFLRAEALYHHIIDDTPACPDVTEAAGDAATVGGTQGVHDVAKHVEDAIRLFSACMKQLRYDGLISANETVKDMSTDTLQYLLIDFYLASLHQRAPAAPGPAGAAGRLAHLQAAVQCIQAFLFQCARTGELQEGRAKKKGGGVCRAACSRLPLSLLAYRRHAGGKPFP